MLVFETTLIMLAVAVLLLAVARRFRLPYPVLLALAGTAVALAPVEFNLHVNPALALALFLAPVLLDAAYDTSPRDLKRYWKPVTSLVLIAVGLTTVAVAWVVHLLVPSIPWPAAVAIGAIVAPPDAVAASTVLRDVRLPHRISVILGGEALLNDASALLIYRLALAAVASGGSIDTQIIAPTFFLSLVGSVVAGFVLAWGTGHITRRIDDAPSSIIAQFVSTFGVWVIAERLKLSPILTMVVYAMTLAHLRFAYLPPRLRIPSYAVWDTAVLVLNILAFSVIGLELEDVIHSAKPGELGHWAIVGGAVLVTVTVVRLVWVLFVTLATRWRIKKKAASAPEEGQLPSWRTGLIIGWSGTRGLVTVATALALPGNFPERSLLLFVAFSVTLGTLLLQGITLRPLVLALGVAEDSTVDDEVRAARTKTAEAALSVLGDAEGDEADGLRKELELQLSVATHGTGGDGAPDPSQKALRARTLAARRDTLLEMRREGAIGDDAFHRLEEELDFADLAKATRT